jgi:uncharacterized phage infection (PIP) family protein YhgE
VVILPSDDALISTEMDKIVKILSRKRRVEMDELASEAGVDKRTLKKWVHVLEEEGFVKLEYKLTKVYVIWLLETGEAEEEVKGKGEEERVIVPKEEIIRGIEKPVEEEKEEKFERVEPVKIVIPKEEEPKKIVVEQEVPPEKEKPGIIEKAEETQRVEEKVEGEEKVGVERGVEEERELTEEEREVVALREELDTYLKEIEKLRAEIAKLKEEKEEIYRTRLLKSQKEAEALYENISDKVMAIEEEIIELKEKIISIPEKVSEADSYVKAISAIRKEGKEIAKKIEEDINKMRSEVKEVEIALEKDLKAAKEELENQMDIVLDLEKKMKKIEDKQKELEKTLEALKEREASILTEMDSANDLLIKLNETRYTLSEKIEGAKIVIDRRTGEIGSLIADLEKLKNVERAIHNYIKDYEAKMGDIESNIKKAEEDLLKVKKAAEVEYLQKYLEELDRMAEKLESEMEQATMVEQDIDERIAAAKARIRELIKESKNLATKLREKEGAKGFKATEENARRKVRRLEKTIKEKEEEREKLFDFE